MKIKEASLIANLKLTVKNHKAQKKVGHRNIHAADNYALQGLSIWVMTKLDNEIGKVPSHGQVNHPVRQGGTHYTT
jgi:hypothetical protein